MAKSDQGKVQATYIPPPKVLPKYPKAYPIKGKTPMGKGKVRKRWKDPDTGDILEWDYQHGLIERYSPKGKHKGEFDPNTGGQTKPARPDRTITPSIVRPRKQEAMVYFLTWFDKLGDNYVGECLLPSVGEDEVRREFDLDQDEPPGDCLVVGREQLRWLQGVAMGVRLDLDHYDYFVEACQPFERSEQ